MVFDIHEIQNVRRRLGITQSELAKAAGVSQSLIAKIESHKLDPTYTNAMKIFSALDSYGRKQEKKASEIMQDKIVSISPHTEIREAISKMKKHGFSQLPVMENHLVIGMVSESDILDALIAQKGRIVEDIMEDAPPVIAPESSLSMISHLLKYCSMVLVSKKGKLVGTITKADLLDKMYSH